ncbi:unnamed protein product [Prorocentrum cordatum]|uniref:Formamidopyrimidine-DNA glycosylase H2TH DNA-binding domain-containing protein n=1 Tax=Prorocentrum cordatum TaxID=2364126 RepID=A0ABN9VTJ2_9DINO|nr:unnamed protein product [Polarella glacialis]
MTARSPNGRFKAGARAIVAAGGVLLRIEVHGKNMFYRRRLRIRDIEQIIDSQTDETNSQLEGNGDIPLRATRGTVADLFGRKGATPSLAVHVHFGMAGAFAVYRGEEPETTATTRLRLETADSGPKLVAHLSAMTTTYGTPTKLYEPLRVKLGQDPLRKDADPERFVASCAAAAKPIGGVLMDQTVAAGVGNIYRTEVLYEAGIHPNQPANTLTRNEALKLWAVTVKQMQAGFRTGSIWGHKPGAACYGRSTSACGGKVKSWAMSGRTVFACAKKQRLAAKRPVAVAPAARAGLPSGKVVSAARAESRKRKTGEGLGVQHVALKEGRRHPRSGLGGCTAAAQGPRRRRARAGRTRLRARRRGQEAAHQDSDGQRLQPCSVSNPGSSFHHRFSGLLPGGLLPPSAERRLESARQSAMGDRRKLWGNHA